MSVSGGPDIVEDGLVAYLDVTNQKSFVGEPTTNEIVNVTWAGDGTNQNGFTKGSTLVTDETLKYNGYQTYLWGPGSNLNCYLSGGDLATDRLSTVWTFSCYVKREDGAAIASMNCYMYYPSRDGSAAATIEDVGNGWYRIYRTRTGTSNYIGLAGFTNFVAETKYYLSGPQLEKKSYPTPYVSTDTTRDKIYNLSKLNDAVMKTGLSLDTTYGVAGLLGNYSSSAYMDFETNAFDWGTDNFTYSAWVRPSDDSVTQVLYEGRGDSLIGTLWVWYGETEKMSLFLTDKPYTGQKLYTTTNSSNQSGKICYMVVAVDRITNLINYYINGELLESKSCSGTSGSITPDSGSWAKPLEDRGGANWKSILYTFQMYRKCLSAAEVRQNFNATKGRFGL